MAVLQRVQDLAGAGARLVKGNHDEMAVRPPAQGDSIGISIAAWTHAQLDRSQLDFLDKLPLVVERGSVALVHASLDHPERWRYATDQRSAAASLDALASPDVRHVFGGHVHHQSLYYRGADKGLMKFAPTPGVAIPVQDHRHWLATLGSVGQPRDGNPQVMYAPFDTLAACNWGFHALPTTTWTLRRAIRRAGSPAYFANRLETRQ